MYLFKRLSISVKDKVPNLFDPNGPVLSFFIGPLTNKLSNFFVMSKVHKCM